MPLKRKFSVELQRTISSAKAFKCIPCYEKFESIAATNFNNSFNLSNKNGQNSNQYHIYFLMDPRITCNLSNEAKQKNFKEIVIWKQFLNSIFYVGKAKSNRTYSHLYDAMNEYRKDIFNPKRSREKCLTLNKLRRIVDIWGNGLGVVSLPPLLTH
ncbi:ankyrin repeat and LEM domain-containing protein 1 isoform X2 [Ceratitis capitata]|uniref:ankyrin repeat and LEM domain-containing protein 1 isoform X2 n=1 Tax=Ceratitis capitata TaxID=7213 RepID=UPI0006188A19|nr:ankyrin repeat and LEM domain-containing protein 1 isoform X2 [Ceratitis capitata]